MRIGVGFDVHPFDESRPLVLGGVTIPGAAGLVGHSDADVLTHAVIDALLGAAGLGDLGSAFPEENVPEGSSSLDLLRQAVSQVHSMGYRVNNVDSTVVLQEPQLAQYASEIRGALATNLMVEPAAVNVKATTTDKLGFVGRGEGASAFAVITITGQPDAP